ncbi:MAG: GIY-YIG nuclease family protein [Planctomycetota bacterium]|nr:GIY-YIG nuclease family protein [Planctomycetota bacterium]
MTWFAYVLLSPRRSTYVGITTDVERRLRQHNGELPGGAKATRANRPWRIGRTYGPFEDRGTATVAERSIKKLRGRRRLHWND